MGEIAVRSSLSTESTENISEGVLDGTLSGGPPRSIVLATNDPETCVAGR